MKKTNLRRVFIQSGIALGSLLAFSPSHCFALANRRIIGSCSRLLDGTYALALFNLENSQEVLLPLQKRAHSLCTSLKRQEVIFFDRRPGDRFYIVDSIDGKLLNTISVPEGYRFYGHGCFDRASQKLYVTANHLESLTGRILVFNCESDYKFVEALPSGGIGPHEVIRHPKKDILYICNGGVQTHPDMGREILNPFSINSNLHIIDLKNGKTQTHPMKHDSLSIRHIDVNENGDAILGLQDKDFIYSENKALVCFYSFKSKSLQTENSSQENYSKVRGYVASVAIDHLSATGISTCPKGDRFFLWDLKTLQIKREFILKGASGAIFDMDKRDFIVTSGSGEVLQVRENKVGAIAKASFQWDNHAELI